jgi:hypothetical protein
MVHDAGPPIENPVTAELQLRRLILALVSFGLVALGAELIAIGHYEDGWQLVPIGLVTSALLTILVHVIAGKDRGLVVLQIILVLMIASGALGIFLHYQANAAFQHDTYPDLGGWELVKRVIHSIAPPALAPGVMAQLGLLGLIYIYKHPARRVDLS